MGWYKDRHVLPDALLNFAVLLGWRGVEKKKTLGLQDIIDNVSGWQQGNSGVFC
jgi:glutamyl/glutaminyl-tRNA synthetase